jgi:hypothetical protein
MKKVIFCIMMVLFCGLSMAVAGDKTLPRPEALSEETISLTEKLSANYDTLVIKDFSADGAEYSRVDEEEKAGILKLLPVLKANIALTLEADLKEKKIFKTIVRNDAPDKSKAVILEGQFSEFNPGSKALKFFVGFGAGKSYIKFKGRLLDAASGKELASFEDRETGYRGSMTLEGYQDLFPHQAKSIGENLAKFLTALY